VIDSCRPSPICHVLGGVAPGFKKGINYHFSWWNTAIARRRFVHSARKRGSIGTSVDFNITPVYLHRGRSQKMQLLCFVLVVDWNLLHFRA